jgi:hypothetical protein
MWGLWWTKRHWGRFSPSILVSPANHSTDFSIIIITRGWHNRPIGGRSAEWILDSTPHYTNLKLNFKLQLTPQYIRHIKNVFLTQPATYAPHNKILSKFNYHMAEF